MTWPDHWRPLFGSRRIGLIQIGHREDRNNHLILGFSYVITHLTALSLCPSLRDLTGRKSLTVSGSFCFLYLWGWGTALGVTSLGSIWGLRLEGRSHPPIRGSLGTLRQHWSCGETERGTRDSFCDGGRYCYLLVNLCSSLVALGSWDCGWWCVSPHQESHWRNHSWCTLTGWGAMSVLPCPLTVFCWLSLLCHTSSAILYVSLSIVWKTKYINDKQ